MVPEVFGVGVTKCICFCESMSCLIYLSCLYSAMRFHCSAVAVCPAPSFHEILRQSGLKILQTMTTLALLPPPPHICADSILYCDSNEFVPPRCHVNLVGGSCCAPSIQNSLSPQTSESFLIWVLKKKNAPGHKRCVLTKTCLGCTCPDYECKFFTEVGVGGGRGISMSMVFLPLFAAFTRPTSDRENGKKEKKIRWWENVIWGHMAAGPGHLHFPNSHKLQPPSTASFWVCKPHLDSVMQSSALGSPVQPVALSGGSYARGQREALCTFHPAHLYLHYQLYCTRSVVQYMQLHVLKREKISLK